MNTTIPTRPAAVSDVLAAHDVTSAIAATDALIAAHRVPEDPMMSHDNLTTPIWLQRDPAWEEAKERLWAMTSAERVLAMRNGELSFRLLMHWASHRPDEVPVVEGEWEFIAVHTVEYAESAPAVADKADSARGARESARPG